MQVLVVEDARDQRRLLCAVVRKLGHEVHEAEDGVQALQLLESEPSIRMVISDWIMPNLDGIGLCEEIRKRDFHRYIYFVLLTGKTDKDAMVQGLSVGADDFLNKPVDLRELEVRLKAGQRVIELEQTLDSRNAQLQTALDRVEKDLAAAAETHEGLLAAPAVLQNVGFDWHFHPSKILGGDMFGYHEVTDEYVVFYQLDVAGHGIPSALFSFALNNLLRNVEGDSQQLEPHKVLEQLNERFQSRAETMLYFTMSYGVIHTPTGHVRISHAGHPPTLWLQGQNNRVEAVGKPGVPVGMMPGMAWGCDEFVMAPGDRLFLYSDGITECEGEGGGMFGDDRLQQLLQGHSHSSMADVIGAVWSDLCRWRGGESFDDDMTYLVMEYRGGSETNGIQ